MRARSFLRLGGSVWTARESSYDDHGFSRFSCWEYAIVVVNLARLTGWTSLILPTALLTGVCCTIGSDLVRGFTNADSMRKQPSLDDLALCIAAKDRLASVSGQYEGPDGKTCSDCPVCAAAGRRTCRPL